MEITGRKKIVFRLVAFILVLAGIEIAARLFYAYAHPEDVVPLSIGRFDERLGWSMRPGSRGTSERTGQLVEYRINSHGLRDEETPYRKSPGTFRILLIGDSWTFGYGVPIEDHYSTLLENRFEGLEVINMGVSAFGIDQALIYLEAEGFRYEPDLVLLFVPHYGGDRHMHARRWGKKKPRFVLEDDELVLIDSHMAASSPALERLQALHWPLRRYSHTYLGLSELVSQLLHGTPSQQDEQDRMNRALPGFLEQMHALGNAIVFRMHDLSAQHGAAFGLVSQLEELHRAAVERGIPSLNVSGALKAPDLHLPEGLGHINEAGNVVLAAEIASLLARQDSAPEP